jgi:hypothetical protein
MSVGILATQGFTDCQGAGACCGVMESDWGYWSGSGLTCLYNSSWWFIRGLLFLKWGGVEVCFSGCTAIACLDQSVESSFLVFMSIALDGWICEMLGFLYCFRSAKSVGRSSNVLIISSGW